MNIDKKQRTTVQICLFALIALSLFSGCGKEKFAADTEPPAQMQFTPRSAETDSIETGIDAVPEGNYIYLSWLPSAALDLAGYRLYRMSEDSSEKQIIADGLELTEYTDRDANLAPNSQTGFSQGFYYWVTALDESSNESALSAEAYYRLMDKPVLSNPVAQGDSLILSWSYNHLDPTVTSGFIVRLNRLESGVWTPIFLENHQEFFPLTSIFIGPLTAGTYRYQVDVVGATSVLLPSGSEAAVQFNLN